MITRSLLAVLFGLAPLVATAQGPADPVRVPLNEAGELDAAEVVARLATRSGVAVARPEGLLLLPTAGLAGSLTRNLLAECLGPDVALRFDADALVGEIRPEALAPECLPRFRARLVDLATRAGEASRRRASYGLAARPSYRPNDPARPTVCLIHGLNSTSAVFRHWVGPLEAAGFGVVQYDYPYNRDLHQTAPAFARDWAEFRARAGDSRPWAVVSHSMGGLLARAYVEGDTFGADVSDLILLAPPNRGSGLAGAQSLLQLIQGLRPARGREARALAGLADGVGAAAEDLTPGSPFLVALEARPRREGVRYHILAGDRGVLTAEARRRVEFQARALAGVGGFAGGLARVAGADLARRLDELTDGLGDGCVSVASTRLDGVADHAVLHADHLELIRAPLLYPDPGPIPGLTPVLERLGVKGTGP